MERIYKCPECKTVLNPERAVILAAKRDDQRLLVGFHPEPGNYELYVPPGTTFQAGDKWEFFCPVCTCKLTTTEDENLCGLEQEAGNGETRKVYFSRIAGEKATYVICGQKLEAKHGKDAAHYVHHFNQIRF
jgi:hypothetical protein